MSYKSIAVTENGVAVNLNEKKIAFIVEEGSGSKVYLDNQKVRDVKEVAEAPAAITALGANLIDVTEDESGAAWSINHEIIVGIRDEDGKGVITLETPSSKRNLVVVELEAAIVAAINLL